MGPVAGLADAGPEHARQGVILFVEDRIGFSWHGFLPQPYIDLRRKSYREAAQVRMVGPLTAPGGWHKHKAVKAHGELSFHHLVGILAAPAHGGKLIKARGV
jgi:hypothetical protein